MQIDGATAPWLGSHLVRHCVVYQTMTTIPFSYVWCRGLDLHLPITHDTFVPYNSKPYLENMTHEKFRPNFFFWPNILLKFKSKVKVLLIRPIDSLRKNVNLKWTPFQPIVWLPNKKSFCICFIPHHMFRYFKITSLPFLCSVE